MMLDKSPEIMEFYNSSINFTDHLGFAYEAGYYDICNVLIKHNRFYTFFELYYESNYTTFDEALQNIKIQSIKSIIKTF